MCIEGQGHFFTIYFPGFVCFVLYKATISGERFTGPLVLWLPFSDRIFFHFYKMVDTCTCVLITQLSSFFEMKVHVA